MMIDNFLVNSPFKKMWKHTKRYLSLKWENKRYSVQNEKYSDSLMLSDTSDIDFRDPLKIIRIQTDKKPRQNQKSLRQHPNSSWRYDIDTI